jgi:hypothetical protein
MVHIWHILYLHYSGILTRTRKFGPYSCENALEPIHSKIGRQLTIPVIAIIFAPAIAHHRLYDLSRLKCNKGMRTGYFPSINHAQTVIGFGSGNFQNRRNVRCQAQ